MSNRDFASSIPFIEILDSNILTRAPVDKTSKVERMMQGVTVLISGVVQPRILYRMLFERGLKG